MRRRVQVSIHCSSQVLTCVQGIVSCPFKQKRGVPVETALPQRRTV